MPHHTTPHDCVVQNQFQQIFWPRAGDVVWWYGGMAYGVVWCGVAWCGMVWYGVVWCVKSGLTGQL